MAVTSQTDLVLASSAAWQRKLYAALAIIEQALRKSRKPYIAYTSGKDSHAVMILCEMVRPGITLAWSDDELELPETLQMMEMLRRIGAPLRTFHGAATHAHWFRPWSDRPYWRDPMPGTEALGRDFQDVLAEDGYDLVYLGLRMEENSRRRNWLLQSGPTYGGTTIIRRCNPIYDWSADDVWALIAHAQVPYNRAYDKLDAIGVPRKSQRVGPLPLARRSHLVDAWPEILADLEKRYQRRWQD